MILPAPQYLERKRELSKQEMYSISNIRCTILPARSTWSASGP